MTLSLDLLFDKLQENCKFAGNLYGADLQLPGEATELISNDEIAIYRREHRGDLYLYECYKVAPTRVASVLSFWTANFGAVQAIYDAANPKTTFRLIPYRNPIAQKLIETEAIPSPEELNEIGG